MNKFYVYIQFVGGTDLVIQKSSKRRADDVVSDIEIQKYRSFVQVTDDFDKPDNEVIINTTNVTMVKVVVQ